MDEILKVIRQRRSVRKYKTDIPKDADIQSILEAGRWAPSGLNNQPWRFLVITERAKKDGLAGFTKYSSIICSAPVVIGVCLDIADSYNRDKDLMAIGACIQNMLLEAYALGLGTCWLGEVLNRKGEAARYLKLTQDLELMGLIALGYPDEDITEGSRKSLKNLRIDY